MRVGKDRDMDEQKRAMTLRQVAALAGTSKSTVSRVLTDHPRTSEATRQRVLGVIEKHGYQPNQLARSLARGRTGLLGVISTNSGSGFFADVIRGVDLAATEQRIRLLCSFAHSAEACLGEMRALGGGGQVEGLLLIAPGLDLFDRPLVSEVPVVLCAARPVRSGGGWGGVDSVTLDNEGAMRGLVRHLAAQGFRRVAHLAGPADNFDALARERAFRAAVARVPALRGTVIPAGLVREDGLRVAQELPEAALDGRCAYVAFNDSVAWGFVEGCHLRRPGTRWPVAITGWDDSPVGSETGLSSVAIPAYELGRAAAGLLLRRLSAHAAATPRHAVMKQPLRLRESSRSHRGSA